MTKKKNLSFYYYENCNLPAIEVIEISSLNENNKTFKSVGLDEELIFENVIRKENHNENQLAEGFLAYFTEE